MDFYITLQMFMSLYSEPGRRLFMWKYVHKNVEPVRANFPQMSFNNSRFLELFNALIILIACTVHWRLAHGILYSTEWVGSGH